jgi:hypothetical protein
MPSNKPLIKTYIDKKYKDKFQFIADNERRSDSNMLEKIVIDYIENYETQYGEIVPDENGTLTTAKPKAVHKDKLSSSKTG